MIAGYPSVTMYNYTTTDAVTYNSTPTDSSNNSDVSIEDARST